MARKEEELRIEPPVAEQPPRSVGFLISQLGFFSSKGFMEALEPVGSIRASSSCMRFVAASEGQSQQALAERLGIPPSRMVALVDHLEEAGLVERRPDPEDRRVRGLHLTSKGRGVLEKAGKIAIDYETRLCAGINREEREQLIDLLQKLQESQTDLRGVHPGMGEDRPMAKLLVHLATGPENPTRGALALLVARTAAEEGHDVQVFLAGDGVQYARPATASIVAGRGHRQLRRALGGDRVRRRSDLPVRACRATLAASSPTRSPTAPRWRRPRSSSSWPSGPTRRSRTSRP